MSKSIRKIYRKIDLGHGILKGFNLPDPLGDAIHGSERALSPKESAEKQAKITRQETDAQSRLMRTMERNLAADLAGENMAEVVAGGTASAIEPDGGKRKRRTGGLTASLGI